MPGGRKAAHVATDLGQDDARAQYIDAGNGGQELDHGAKGLDVSVNLLSDVADRRVKGVDLLQMQAQQETVMPGDAAAQRFAQRLRRGLDPAMRQLRQPLGIALAGDQRLDHRPAGQTHDIRDHRVELDVGIFQRFLQTLDMLVALPHQLLASA